MFLCIWKQCPASLTQKLKRILAKHKHIRPIPSQGASIIFLEGHKEFMAWKRDFIQHAVGHRAIAKDPIVNQSQRPREARISPKVQRPYNGALWMIAHGSASSECVMFRFLRCLAAYM